VSSQSDGLAGISVSLELEDLELDLNLPLPGLHNAHNLAAAILGAYALQSQLDWNKVATALRRFVPPVMRLQVHDTRQGVRVLNDAYNANPRSMQAVVGLAQELKSVGQRVALVLGDMLELGKASSSLHEELGGLVAQLQPECVAYVGAFSSDFAKGLGTGSKLFVSADREAVINFVIAQNVDVVLVKASRGIGLEEVVKGLIAQYGGETMAEASQFR
jgi:UDP-N-acetylmuramoyl-tripeptide--D-alanyl-D-alanine ligase